MILVCGAHVHEKTSVDTTEDVNVNYTTSDSASYNLNTTDNNLNITDSNRNITGNNLNVTDHNLNITDINQNVTDNNLNVTDKPIDINLMHASFDGSQCATGQAKVNDICVDVD